MNTLDQALHLAGLGYALLRLEPERKNPAAGIPWREDSTCSLSRVRGWFADRGWNTGIDCGKSGIVVIDIDSPEAGDRWEDIWAEHDSRDWEQVRYPIVATRRAWHLYFGQPDITIGCPKRHPLGDGIDIKGDGGFVVAPGSVVCFDKEGNPLPPFTYDLAQGDLAEVPVLPPGLTALFRAAHTEKALATATRSWLCPPDPLASWRKLAELKEQIINAPDGQQNDTINAASYLMRDHLANIDPAEIRAELEAAAEAGNHPMHRARPTIRSGLGI